MRRDQLLEALSTPYDQARIRSAGGPVAAAFLGECITKPSDVIPDDEFQAGCTWRLGVREGNKKECQHTHDLTGKVCKYVLDPQQVHAVCCKAGQGVYRVHNAIAGELTKITKGAGLWTTTNAVIPALAQVKEGEKIDAELDVVTWSPEPGLSLQLDVNVRHPSADRYIKQSCRTDGVAARKAEQEKQARYPSRNGIRVTTFAIETFGRLGNEASETMQKLATAAAERDKLRAFEYVAASDGRCR